LKDENADRQTQNGGATPFSAERNWLPEFPSASGDLCAKALIRLGWIPVAWSQGMYSLIRGGERIFVPRGSVLDHRRIDALLRRAGVPPLTFIDALESVCEREIEDFSVRRTGIRRRPQ
jgi:hypothetical protein